MFNSSLIETKTKKLIIKNNYSIIFLIEDRQVLLLISRVYILLFIYSIVI